ncbi:class I SAM-dependent methyltransferase [Robertkochia marina]|uniref:Class I SAM-dependent methyltransferase n=1 Tax=Robertkochia marina TaxID=1227945 RepID=A0A4S3M2G0_9FLAO|nr:class I SAM-dependent methyltransferase [Robertkochia marina]THD69312.1 class I SAM-dependent methyltransferase [Robertkochia marina]TRZ47428.1 class I SAM-dependent methyltransferase [Robertkochia marina]
MKTAYPKNIKDHFLSQENFRLEQDATYGFLKTVPQPRPDRIKFYYESDKYLSHDDSATGLFASLYRWVKSMNLNRKTRLVNSYHPSYNSILDIGCGTGDFLAQIPANKKRQGVEVSPKAASIARSKNLDIKSDLDQLKEPYDVITLWHVLEHLYEPDRMIQKISTHLKDDGLLIIALPNYKSYDAQHYKSYWAGYDVPRHLYHYDKTALTRLLSSQNLNVVKFLPMYWDAYYVSLLSEGYLKNILAPVRAFIIATISNLRSLYTKQPSSIIYIIKKS